MYVKSMNYGTKELWRRWQKIEEVENDRTQLEYKKDRMWMAEELAALDIEEKLKWLEAENEETEEIGEQWDRLGP